MGYTFPEAKELTMTLDSVLDDEVDEKYYIKSEKAEKLIEHLVSTGKLDDI